jgi:hypothetical protein
VRFTADGKMLVTGTSQITGWTLPDLVSAFRVRPLRQPRGVATQPGGSHVLCGNERFEFALLDSSSGETLAVCSDQGYARDQPFALSACGQFVIYAHGDTVRVREIATNVLSFEHRFADGWVSSIQPMSDGADWLLHVHVRTHDENAGPRAHFEVWSWPFAQPRHVLHTAPFTHVAIASRTGRIAVQGVARPRVTALRVYDPGADQPAFEQEIHFLDRLIGWLDDEHFAHANDPGVEVREARTGTMICRVELPGYPRYGCVFSPDGRDWAIVYSDRGFAYARGVFDGERTTLRIDDPFSAPRRHSQPSRTGRNPWYELAAASATRAIPGSSVDEVMAALREFERAAWTPVVAKGSGPVTGSKFGGTPYLAEQGSWPRCGECGSWLQLALQLNPADVPTEVRDRFVGILQVFFCTAEACVPTEPFSRATLVRLVAIGGRAAYDAPPFADAFLGSQITGWQKHRDLPADNELELRGAKLTDPDPIGWYPFPLDADKLMGWPCWHQNVDYVKCPTCGGAMHPIVQIDSERNLPYMFGDGGVAWVSQCPTHRNVLSFHCSW